MKIGDILNQILTENYKTQTVNFIKQGINPDVVKQYLEKFKVIKDKGFKELFSKDVEVNVPVEKRGDIDAYKNFHDLEVIVDYVGGQRSVKPQVSGEDIEVDGKPIYEDDNFEIYFADTPRACIKYKGKLPYSWCIARSDSSNMFFTYRFKPYEPAFYFVKDKKQFKKEFSVTNVVRDIATGKFKYPYHFFVVQVGKNAKMDDNESNQYVVTSANNDGDKQMSWDDIIKIKPALARLKEQFQPKPFTPEERKKFESFRNGISDDEFKKLSYEQKREYLDIYPSIGKPITTNQFLNLPNDLKNLYISFGVGLNDEQYASIKDEKDLLKRYKQISERKFNEYLKKESWERRQLELSYTELLNLNQNQVKEYLETLSKKDINKFIKKYGVDKYEYIVKHTGDKHVAKNVNDITLLKQLASGSEEAETAINQKIPDDFTIKMMNGKVIITSNTIYFNELISKDKENFFDMMENRYWDRYGNYYDSYFEGDSEQLENTYKYHIEEFLKSGQLKETFLENDLSYTYETIDDLLDTYKLKDKCLNVLYEEYDSAMSEAAENAWTEIRNDVSNVIMIDRDDIKLNPTAFFIYLKDANYDIDFFVNDENKFKDNLTDLIDNILDVNDEIDSTDSIYETVNETRYNNMNVDNRAIQSKFESYIDDAVDEYVDENPVNDYEDDETPDQNEKSVVKLKSQIIASFNNTLKRMGFDPYQSTIENEIVKIEFDRKKFNLQGKIYAKVTDQKTKKDYEGYMNIKDIPMYFKNYKLYEEILRIKKLLN